MENGDRRSRRGLPVWAGLLLLYGVFTALRALLAAWVSVYPEVIPDEPLYYNLARSLWTGGEVAMRGQPITYDSLLYPLFLAPLFALPDQVDLYRVIQVVNAVAINTAVFPAWALAKRITGDNRRAWAVALLTLLLPDLSLSRYILAENLGFPLMVLTLWLAARAFSSRKASDAVWAAVCAFLLYLIKPGLIALAAAGLIVLVALWARERDGKRLWQALAFAGVMAALWALWQVVTRFVLRIDYAFESLYQSQTQGLSLAHLWQTLEGSLLYLFYFPVACLVFPLAVPLAHTRSLRGEEGALWRTTALAILLTILGTCYIIYVDEHTGDPFFSRVHLRYLAAYVPAMLAVCLSPSLEGKRLNGPMAGIMAYLVAGAVVFSFASLYGGSGNPVDGLMLASVTHAGALPQDRKLPQLLLLAGLLGGGYALVREGWSRRVRGVVLALFAALCICNNVATYKAQQDGFANEAIMQDARQAAETIQADEALSVTADGEYLLTSAMCLDLYSRKPLATVELHDLIAQTQAGGVYEPFVPQSYWKTDASRLTPQARWLILDTWTLPKVILAEGVRTVPMDENVFVLVDIEAEREWVHSALSGGAPGNKVQAGMALSVFDSALVEQEMVQITLWLRAGTGGATLIASREEYRQTQALEEGRHELALEIPAATGGEPLRVALEAYGDIYIETYAVDGRQHGKIIY